jgi:SNF2 family DNA or RNA helicase
MQDIMQDVDMAFRAGLLRLVGQTTLEERKNECNVFNNLFNPRSRLDGINLVAAIREIIVDASWNPSHDVFTEANRQRIG